MDDYLPRLADSLIEELLEDVSAIMIVGPRASGKTTAAARFAASVVRLDRPEEAAPFAASPDAALAALPTPVLLDEWQEVPRSSRCGEAGCGWRYSPRSVPFGGVNQGSIRGNYVACHGSGGSR